MPSTADLAAAAADFDNLAAWAIAHGRPELAAVFAALAADVRALTC